MDMQPSSTRLSSAASIADVETDLRAIVGEEHVCAARPEDSIDGVAARMVLEPGTPEELARALKTATEAGLHVIPRGGASKMEWGNPPRAADLVMSTRRLNRIVEHAWADMTVTVEAGCTVQQLQQTLAAHGQRLALDPLWLDTATVGGILATNDSGPLRIRYGSLRDLLIGITLALPDGTLAKSGGKVVKNVAGYDLPKLAIGSLGTLGVITQATFRLHPLPRVTRTLCFRAQDYRAMSDVLSAVLDSTLVPTGLQVRAADSGPPEIDVRFEGTAAGCEQQLAQTLRLAAGAEQVEPSTDVWNTRVGLWNGNEPSLVAKFSLLSASIGVFFDLLKATSQKLHLSWRAVAQAVGVGLLRLEGPSCSALLAAVQDLRQNLQQSGGSLVILRCPAEIKSQTDVWGSAGDALQLMQNVKAQFDPTGTLNPGRFIGGI
jgi:glycolate oxidase FAD binding subunit